MRTICHRIEKRFFASFLQARVPYLQPIDQAIASLELWFLSDLLKVTRISSSMFPQAIYTYCTFETSNFNESRK